MEPRGFCVGKSKDSSAEQLAMAFLKYRKLGAWGGRNVRPGKMGRVEMTARGTSALPLEPEVKQHPQVYGRNGLKTTTATKMGSQHVAQAGLKFGILLPQTPGRYISGSECICLIPTKCS